MLWGEVRAFVGHASRQRVHVPHVPFAALSYFRGRVVRISPRRM